MDLLQILAGDRCNGLLPVVRFVRKGIFPIIQIGVPIILIIMGAIDLGKAVLSSDDKEIKGATSKLIKRCIAAVAVFFVVTIVTLLMNLFTSADTGVEGTASWAGCWEDAGN